MAQTVAEPGGMFKPGLAAPADEFALVCACLSPVGVPDPAGLDLDRVARIARRHQVTGLVAARLATAGHAVPPAMQRRALLSRQAGLSQLAAALALAQALEAARIEAAFLKGLALSQQAFGSPLLRYAADIDVLVRIDQVASGWQVLDGLGYRRITPAADLSGPRLALYCRASKDSIHHHPETGITIELHWRLADEMDQPRLPPAARLAVIELAPGQRLPVLSGEDQFRYLCIHGAAHGWARLKWLADVAALLHRAPDGGSALWRDAAAQGCGIAAASAILLAEELFALPRPPGFVPPRAVRLKLLLAIARRVIRAGGGMLELEATAWRGWTELLAKSLVATSWRGRLAVLRRLALSGEDIAQVAIPPALYWAYPALRIPLLVRRRLARARGRG